MFYARTARTFVFGSEIKSLLMHPGVERRLDLVALSQIFTFWWCLPPRSIFQDVLELPPGHSLTVERGDIAVRRHWQIEFGIEPNGHAESPPPPPPSKREAVSVRERESAARLPPESAKWQHLEGACRELFARFGYGEARPPIVESTELFSRGVGEATDMVEKEIQILSLDGTTVRDTGVRIGVKGGPAAIRFADK